MNVHFVFEFIKQKEIYFETVVIKVVIKTETGVLRLSMNVRTKHKGKNRQNAYCLKCLANHNHSQLLYTEILQLID